MLRALAPMSKSIMKSTKRLAKTAPNTSSAHPRASTTNRLLKALSDADHALLSPYLTEQPFPLRMNLETPGVPIKSVFFIEHGIASVVALPDRDTQVEVGLIGCEGVSGFSVILGSDRSPFHTYMQVAGSGFRIPTAELLPVIEQSPSLKLLLIRYAQAFAIQTTYTAAANAKANIESRLARWLLMAHDRMPKNAIPLTHEFLSIMLGVRRAGVTDCLRALAKRGLIQTPKNSLIELVNREGLEQIAGHYYGAPEREYKRLLR
jgi:CRP-like cAMP-binding protein